MLLASCGFNNPSSQNTQTSIPNENAAWHESAENYNGPSLLFGEPVIEKNTMTVPLNGRQLKHISGISAGVLFDETKLQFVGAEKDVKLDSFFLTNDVDAGLINLALASSGDVSVEDGEILKLKFYVLDPSQTELLLQQVQIIDADLKPVMTKGFRTLIDLSGR